MQPTPGFLPEESQGQRSLVGYSSWGRKESDKTERLSTAQSLNHCRLSDDKYLFQDSRERERGALTGTVRGDFMVASKLNLAGWIEFCWEG